MAVFFTNTCHFDDCGKTFQALADLIHHIEHKHIDNDPATNEQREQEKPECLPLSYVLKFSKGYEHRENITLDVKQRLIQHANRSILSKPVRIEIKNGEEEDDHTMTESEGSNGSWTPVMDIDGCINSIRVNPVRSSSSVDKPFACNIPGCKKRYKNVNGIKYHYKNGHNNTYKFKKSSKHFHKSLKVVHDVQVQSTSYKSESTDASQYGIRTPELRYKFSTDDAAAKIFQNKFSKIQTKTLVSDDKVTVISNKYHEETEMQLLKQVSASYNLASDKNVSFNVIDTHNVAVTSNSSPTIAKSVQDSTTVESSSQNIYFRNSFVSTKLKFD